MNTNQLLKELTFKAVRSGGAGGQHVNKVSSKIVLFFDVQKSESLSVSEKGKLLNTLKSKLNSNQVLILNCDETRSQHKNKEIVIQRFLDIIQKGLIKQKTRKPTKVPKSVIAKRLDSKKRQSDKKANRKKPPLD